jgi:hypothetical protein
MGTAPLARVAVKSHRGEHELAAVIAMSHRKGGD